MAWEVEYSDEFGEQFEELDESTQEAIAAVVGSLEALGPRLGFPYTSDIKGSKVGALRELRVQHKGDPWRVLYAFDPRRNAYLILLGNKGGNDRFYEEEVPRAERIFEQHLRELGT